MDTQATPLAENNVATPAVQVPPGHAAFKFHFRTEKIRNEKEEVIGTGKKHPDVTAVLPVPTETDLIDFLAKPGKEHDFLMEVVNEAIKGAARAQINAYRADHPDVTITPDVLDLTKLTFTAVASMDKRERGADIPEEQFSSFYEDYKTVMAQLNIDPVRIEKHIAIFKTQFRTARYDKPALGMLKERLSMYAAKTEQMDDNEDVYGFLTAKLDKFLQADEKKLVEAL